MRFLESDEADDPILSVVNLIDVFLVVIAVLAIVAARNPLSPLSQNDAIVIENPGKDNMRMTIKKGQELTHYESNGQIGQGEGTKAGSAYRLDDGRMIYVPEQGEGAAK